MSRIKHKLTKSARAKVYAKCDYKCQCCGVDLRDCSEQISIDHKIPKAHGGSNMQENLWVLCRPCNFKKGNRIIDEHVNSYIQERIQRLRFELKID